MKTKYTLLLTLFLGLFGALMAQDDNIELPFIEVTGTAEKELIPDEIFISISIRERTEGKNKITADEQLDKLTKALKGISPSLLDHFFLSDADADYVHIRWRKKDVISSLNYLLKVSDASMVEKVFKKLDELKIQDAYISKTSHSKIIELKKEVRILAIKAAKDKADYLLEAIGEETGKPVKVNEVTNNIMPYYNNQVLSNRSYKTESFDIEKKERTIQFQKIKIKASIYVKFRIK